MILAGGQAYTIQGNYAVPATPDVSSPTCHAYSGASGGSSSGSAAKSNRGHEGDCCDALFVSASPSPTSCVPPATSLGGCCAPATRFAPGPPMGLAPHELCSPYASAALPAPCPVLAYGPGGGGPGGGGGGPCAQQAPFPYQHHSVAAMGYHHPGGAFPLAGHQGPVFAVSPVTPLGHAGAALHPKNGTISLAAVSVPLSLYLASVGGAVQQPALGTATGGALAVGPHHAPPDAETPGAAAAYSAFPAPPGPAVHLDVSL